MLNLEFIDTISWEGSNYLTTISLFFPALVNYQYVNTNHPQKTMESLNNVSSNKPVNKLNCNINSIVILLKQDK